MPDVVVTTGVDTSGFKTGMAELRSYGTKTFSGLKSEVAGALAGASLVQYGRNLLEYGDRIQDLSERFNVSAESIQHIGNAAAQNGSSLEGVASAFGKLAVAQSKANGGSAEAVRHFAALGITIDDLRRLSLDDLMLKIGQSSGNAADVIAVLGRNGQELIPTLQGIADGSIDIASAIDNHTIKSLGDLSDRLEKLKQDAAATFAPVLVSAAEAVGKAFHNMGEALGVGIRALQIGPKQALAEFKEGLVIEDAINAAREQQKKAATERRHNAGGAAGDDPPANADDGTGGGGGASANADSLREQLAAAQEKQYRASLDAAGKLADIDLERTRLQEQLNALAAIGGGQDGEEEKIRLSMLDLDGQSLATQKEIDKIKADIAEKADKQALAAAADLADSRENTRELQAQLSGHEEIARQLKLAYDFDKLINAAYAEGNDALAAQLTTEKALSLEVEKRASAQKKSDQEKTESLDQYYARAAAAGYTVGNTESLSAGHTSIQLGPKALALQERGFFITQAAVTNARDPRTGAVDDDALARAIVQNSNATGNGTRNLSFTEQLRVDQLDRQFAEQQAAQAAANSNAAAAAAAATRAQLGTAVLSGNDAVFQQILAQLQQMNQVITPPPG